MRNKKRQFNKTILKPRINKKFILWATTTSFLVLQVFFTIQTATSGAALASLEKERIELERENSYLSEEIVRSSSLTQSKEKAESLGYLQPEKILYVKGDDFLAKLP